MGEPDRRLPKHVRCVGGGRGVVGFNGEMRNRLWERAQTPSRVYN